MGNRTTKWLLYTVGVGLLPIICRCIVWLCTVKGNVDAVSAGDFVAFGLVMHIAIVNELEHIADSDRRWKTLHNGLSLLFIAIYGLLFGLSLLAGPNLNIVKLGTITCSAIILSVVSFLICFAVYYRLSSIAEAS